MDMLHRKCTVTNAAVANSENLNKEHELICLFDFFSFFVETVWKNLNYILSECLMNIYKYIETFV